MKLWNQKRWKVNNCGVEQRRTLIFQALRVSEWAPTTVDGRSVWPHDLTPPSQWCSHTVVVCLINYTARKLGARSNWTGNHPHNDELTSSHDLRTTFPFQYHVLSCLQYALISKAYCQTVFTLFYSHCIFSFFFFIRGSCSCTSCLAALSQTAVSCIV